ncbi:hypothetical protein K1T73_16400 [Roseovarius sp. SCSIO 43702]|uniref:hypothetical protein n=1 Tax=Roseovarius sp. SCSIO 43702 TaxID=2823043 RepID=UPI001C734030|nr:hypothetical protein [Roseovarius sp. SCSIO 43702]QYX56598.1 hypothetical protein K1T73_16400 [Roseovarius sp. SCSIO 43702]
MSPALSLFLVGLPIATFAIFACLPNWRSYLVGWAIFAVLFAIAATAPFPVSSSTSIRGIDLPPVRWSLLAALATLPAQGWRAWRHRQDRASHYHLVLLPSIALLILAGFQILP